MGNAGRTEPYSMYVAVLDNESLYSSEGVARNARSRGLTPKGLQGEELDHFCRGLAHAMAMRINRKIKGPPDGIDRSNPNKPRDAYLGIRWKATVHTRYLDEADRELVARFKAEESFRYMQEEDDALDGDTEEAFEPTTATGAGWAPGTLPLLAVLPALFLLLVMWLLPDNNEAARVRRLAEARDIGGLEQLLYDAAYTPYRAGILAALAENRTRADGPGPVVDDLSSLSAVFAFDRYPVVLFGVDIVRLGDPLTLADEHGYVAEINADALVLATPRGSREFRYPPLALFGETNWRTTPVRIYPEGDNLQRILKTALIAPGRMAETGTDLIQSRDEAPARGAVVGSFQVADYGAFLDLLAPRLGFSRRMGRLDFSAADAPYAGYIGFDNHFHLIDTTVDDVLHEYGRLLGVDLSLRSGRASTRLLFPPTQFEEFVEALGFSVRETGRTAFELGDRT